LETLPNPLSIILESLSFASDSIWSNIFLAASIISDCDASKSPVPKDIEFPSSGMLGISSAVSLSLLSSSLLPSPSKSPLEVLEGSEVEGSFATISRLLLPSSPKASIVLFICPPTFIAIASAISINPGTLSLLILSNKPSFIFRSSVRDLDNFGWTPAFFRLE